MNHRTYDGQRYSPLDKINKAQRQESQARLCRRHRRHLGQREPGSDAARRGRLPLRRRPMGRALQDRRPLRRRRPHPVAHGPRPGEAAAVEPRRRAVGQSGRSPRRTIRRASSAPTRKPARSCGRRTFQRQPDVQLTAAPLAVKDKIIVGAAGGDRGVRDWIAALDAATGKLEWRKYVIPAPGEPGSETWKDKNNAWQTGGGAMWVTGTYDVATNQVIWGTGNPVPMFDATYRPGRQSLHQQRDLVESRFRQDELVLPVHAGRPLGLRRGRHAHPDRRRRSTARRAS